MITLPIHPILFTAIVELLNFEQKYVFSIHFFTKKRYYFNWFIPIFASGMINNIYYLSY